MATSKEYLVNNGQAHEYDFRLRVVPYDEALIAMDKFSKQESIAFKKFWDNYTPTDGKFPNDEELYNIFKKTNN